MGGQARRRNRGSSRYIVYIPSQFVIEYIFLHLVCLLSVLIPFVNCSKKVKYRVWKLFHPQSSMMGNGKPSNLLYLSSLAKLCHLSFHLLKYQQPSTFLQFVILNTIHVVCRMENVDWQLFSLVCASYTSYLMSFTFHKSYDITLKAQQ